jgi:trans-aconitate methyltransferase
MRKLSLGLVCGFLLAAAPAHAAMVWVDCEFTQEREGTEWVSLQTTTVETYVIYDNGSVQFYRNDEQALNQTLQAQAPAGSFAIQLDNSWAGHFVGINRQTGEYTKFSGSPWHPWVDKTGSCNAVKPKPIAKSKF